MKHGFIKVAAASPVIKLADAYYNAQRTIECIKDAEKQVVMASEKEIEKCESFLCRYKKGLKAENYFKEKEK